MPNPNFKKTINSIPLFLSLNDKRVPGFVDGDTPHGVISYEPDEETKKYVQTRFHLNSLKINNETPCVEMIAVMGSVGTIAYTKKSDFDYWVCIDRALMSRESQDRFNRKVEAVQKWVSDDLKTEVHLFVNDIENIKRNVFAEDDDEAFGSTTGAVLKDEFFRSSIIVAGKIPFWWVIPKFISDSEYNRLFSKLPEEYRQEWFADLGNLFEISREDFLGAALFQLIKSLGNPFKSIIKIGVLEKYLFGPDDSPLLSQKIKLNILRDKMDNKIIDSYVLMFEEVYEYYESAIEDKSLLKILRQNLYLKIDPQLSKYAGMKNTGALPYKVIVMFRYVKEWGWPLDELKELDDFENWDYNKIIIFWNQVKKFMLISYQRISSQLPSMNIADKISETDFMLLSRKIKTHFSASIDKIDNYITFKDTPHESILIIEPENITIDTHEWRLQKRNTGDSDRFVSTIIQSDRNLLKLLAWASINQIFDPVYTRLKIQSGYQRVIQNHITEVMTGISKLFDAKKNKFKNDYFLKESFNLVNMIVLNFNLENAEKISVIHHIYMTSWGESYIKQYTEEDDLITIINTVLNDAQKNKRQFDDYCMVISPEPHRKIYRDIEKLIRESHDFFISGRSSTVMRVISKVLTKFVSFTMADSKLSVLKSDSWLKILSTLNMKPHKNIKYLIHGDDSVLVMMNSFLKNCRPGSISAAYQEVRGYYIINICNESGNIFSFIKPTSAGVSVLHSFYHFIKRSIEKHNESKDAALISGNIKFFKASTDKFGKTSFTDETRIIYNSYLGQYNQKANYSANISLNSSGEMEYSLIKDDARITDCCSFNSIPQSLVRKDGIKDKQGSALIDCITFTSKNSKTSVLGTTLYFLEKYKLEYIIEKIIR
jgi:adenylate cyclase class 1